MKFRDLPIGAKFRFHSKGPEHTKTSEVQAQPDVDVVYDEPSEPAPPTPHVPTGSYNIVELGKGSVRLDGTFTAEELEALLAQMRKRGKK